ncbi:MAG TPA: hypothetical protein VMB79_04350, partial [Jatrophihabitans sp.]|nr:hypothetical protein [Jatrophihabitans sp.]
MSAVADVPAAAELAPPAGTRPAPRTRRPRYGTHLFLVAMSVLWLAPLLWTLYTSLRPKSDTDRHGYFSLAHGLTL